MNKNVKGVINLENNVILPIIIFLTMFIILIIALVIVQNKRRNGLKQTIEELDYEKNRLIGVPILSELSKVRELVKTENLKQKLSKGEQYVAKRLGLLNAETEYVLERFQVEAPSLLSNVKLKVSNVDINQMLVQISGGYSCGELDDMSITFGDIADANIECIDYVMKANMLLT